MTAERGTPLRQRTVEDRRIRGRCDKAQKSRIRAIKRFAAFQAITRHAIPKDLPVSAHNGHTGDPIDLQHAHRGAAITFRHDLRARGMQREMQPEPDRGS